VKILKKLFNKITVTALILGAASQAFAADYQMPEEGFSIIGKLKYHKPKFSDSTVKIASQNNLGMNAVIEANPGTTRKKLKARDAIVVPTAHILPQLAQEGIIVNLPEMRMYYYPDDKDIVMTYPIGIGKIGNNIPVENTKITRKAVNPYWYPGPDVRKYNEAHGVKLPKALPPGPDNPLGPYVMYLGIPTFLIHSTVFPDSVGTRASFGCVRMNETDIREIYPVVKRGTKVFIVNMPNKVAWNGDKLYLETHPMLHEFDVGKDANLTEIVKAIEGQVKDRSSTIIDWQLVAHLASEPDGLPHEIGVKI